MAWVQYSNVGGERTEENDGCQGRGILKLVKADSKENLLIKSRDAAMPVEIFLYIGFYVFIIAPGRSSYGAHDGRPDATVERIKFADVPDRPDNASLARPAKVESFRRHGSRLTPRSLRSSLSTSIPASSVDMRCMRTPSPIRALLQVHPQLSGDAHKCTVPPSLCRALRGVVLVVVVQRGGAEEALRLSASAAGSDAGGQWGAVQGASCAQESRIQ
ncbi:hypothetical protein B0H13DRAFT_1919402 [Mycena leptocephala]|nr:hypothetical protein B0H13DRAFT_1919402 [Mycena leptocephala]